MAKNALGYKPKEAGKKFPQGVAKIIVGTKQAKITFIGETTPEFDTGEPFKSFNLSELPLKLATNSKGEYFVKLNRDADEVMSIGPVNGVFDAKCVDLSRPSDNEDPAPYTITPQDKNWQPYDAFNAYFEITSKGQFKGVRESLFLHYKFTDDGEGNAIWDGQLGNPKAKWLPKLVEFCEATDCVGEPIEWPDDGNVLPELLERILEADRTIQIVVKNGYVDSLLIQGYDYTDDDEDSVDDEFPPEPKKKAKSKKPTKSTKPQPKRAGKSKQQF